MELVPPDARILLLVEEVHRREPPVRLNDVEPLHIGGIAEPDPPAGEPAVDLVFHLADGDDGVRGYGALDLKQEIRIELLLRDPPDLPGL